MEGLRPKGKRRVVLESRLEVKRDGGGVGVVETPEI